MGWPGVYDVVGGAQPLMTLLIPLLVAETERLANFPWMLDWHPMENFLLERSYLHDFGSIYPRS